VYVTVRKDPKYKLAFMHDVQVRVGPIKPTRRVSPATANLECITKPGQLASKLGQTVKLKCMRVVAGRYLTVQIM